MLVNRIHFTKYGINSRYHHCEAICCRWQKELQKTPSNRYHIAYTECTKAIIIVNKHVFILRKIKCKMWLAYFRRYINSYQYHIFNRKWLYTYWRITVCFLGIECEECWLLRYATRLFTKSVTWMTLRKTHIALHSHWRVKAGPNGSYFADDFLM